MLTFLRRLPKPPPQFVREHDSQKPSSGLKPCWNPRPLSGGRNSESTSGPTREGRNASRRGEYYELSMASYNSGLARTTKRTPTAPREGLFWSRKHSTGLVSVKIRLLFLNGHPATPVLRTAGFHCKQCRNADTLFRKLS